MSSDRRKSFRCPVVDSPAAVMLIGETKVPVKLLDESRDGFSVLAEQRPQIQPPQVVWLETEAVCAKVRVIAIRRHQGQYRLGLERMSELPERTPRRWPLAGLFRGGRSSAVGATRMRVLDYGLVMMLIIGMSAAGLTWWLVLRNAAEDLRSSSFSLTSGDSANPGARNGQAAVRQAIANATADWNGGPRRREAMLFVLPSLADQLQLTTVQRTRIELIVADTASSAPDLHALARSGGAARLTPRSEVTLRAAMAAVTAILDDQQRRKWQEILAAAR